MIALIHFDTLTLAFWSPGPAEMLVLAVVALLLYGGNLPEVARSWGKSFAEFRRGLTGFQNELNEVIYSEPDQLPYHEESEFEARDDSRLAEGYEEADDYQDDPTAEESISDDPTASDPTSDYRPDEFSPGEPPEDEPMPEVDESDQTVRDASAETVVIDPDKNPSKDTGQG